MPAKYYFKENPGASDDEQKKALHPRILYSGTITTDRIFSEIATASSYTEADLEGMMHAITERISQYLVDGYRVELGKMGYFSAKLKARPVTDKNEIRSESVFFDNVNFRASPGFVKRPAGFVERARPPRYVPRPGYPMRN